MLLLASGALEASTKLGTIRTTKVKHRITQLPRQPQDSFQNSGHMLKVYQFTRFSFVKLMQEVHRQTQEREAGDSHRLGSGMKFLGTVGEPGARGQSAAGICSMVPRQFGQPYTVGAGSREQVAGSREQGFGSMYRGFPSSIKGLSRGSQCFPSCCGRFRS